MTLSQMNLASLKADIKIVINNEMLSMCLEFSLASSWSKNFPDMRSVNYEH